MVKKEVTVALDGQRGQTPSPAARALPASLSVLGSAPLCEGSGAG